MRFFFPSIGLVLFADENRSGQSAENAHSRNSIVRGEWRKKKIIYNECETPIQNLETRQDNSCVEALVNRL